MTPQEKAKELVDRFRLNVLDYEGCGLNSFKAKQCAKISVDEIIKELTEEISPSVHGFRHQYWQQVKKHIQKL